MPSGEIAQIGIDHASRVSEFILSHAGAVESFDFAYDLSAVAPAMEIATVESEHFAYESELSPP